MHMLQITFNSTFTFTPKSNFKQTLLPRGAA